MTTVDASPSDIALREARQISLWRQAGSDAARAMATDVWETIFPELKLQRIGPKGTETHIHQTSVILAGLLQPGRKAPPQSAQRSPKGAMWDDAKLVGSHVFWSKIDAMHRVGLVGVRLGTRHGQKWPSENGGPATVDYRTSQPTKLWANPKLLDLADRHGVLSDFSAHWCLSPNASSKPPIVKANDEATVVDWNSEKRPASLPRQQVTDLVSYRRWIAALNAELAQTITVSGCRFPAFVRRFKGDLRLGGRLYAVGNDTFQSARRVERPAFRINGEPVALVDIHASYLTVFLALTGHTRLPSGDLYTLPGVDRKAVKAFVLQVFGNGNTQARWATRQDAAVTQHDPKPIKAAVLAAYPGLAQIGDVLPPDLSAVLPNQKVSGKHGMGWAAGQYLTFRESEAVIAAIDYVRGRGGVALPFHDALMVPLNAVRWAKEGLEGAFQIRLGIKPVLSVATGAELAS